MECEFEIKGYHPLMMNNPLAGKLELKEPDEKLAKEQAEKRLYKNNKGESVLPAVHLEGAFIQAAKDVKVPGQRNKKYTQYAKTLVRFSPEYIPIDGTWETDVRQVRNPATGGRFLTARPIYQEWTVRGKILVADDELISENAVKEILELAGKICGVGTFRAKFGQFEVTKFNKVK